MTTTRRHPLQIAALLGLLLLAIAGLGLLATPASARTTAPDDTAAPAATTTRGRIVEIAQAEYNNDSRNHEINECNFYFGHEFGGTDSGCPSHWRKADWCAAFVSFVWNQAGNVEESDTLTGAANSVRLYGLRNDTWHHADSSYVPKPGDGFVFTDKNNNDRADHTGTVISADADSVTTIEGNWSNRVSRVTRARHDANFWGFIEPKLEQPDGTPPPPPPAHVYRTGSAGTMFEGLFYSFFRRADNRVLRHLYTPNEGWSYHDMAGSVLSTPSTIMHRGDLWVFARGSDNQLTYRVQTGEAWTDWKWMPGEISGAPATGVMDERMFVIAREGSALKYRYYDLDTGWNESDAWLGIGQPSATVNVVTDPVVGFLDGRMAVVVRGSDGNVWLRWVSAGSTPVWTAWTKLTGAVAAGTPAVATEGNNLHVFARTTGGDMHYYTFAKGATSWLSRGLGSAPEGAFTGSPSAISFSDLLTVYSRNDAGQLLYRHLEGGQWSAWLQLGRPGTANLDSSPIAMQNGATRYVAARANNEELYVRSYREDSGWSSWTYLPSNLAPMP